jgi:hypothetical protein
MGEKEGCRIGVKAKEGADGSGWAPLKPRRRLLFPPPLFGVSFCVTLQAIVLACTRAEAWPSPLARERGLYSTKSSVIADGYSRAFFTLANMTYHALQKLSGGRRLWKVRGREAGRGRAVGRIHGDPGSHRIREPSPPEAS